jgi:hypothetical protein
MVGLHKHAIAITVTAAVISIPQIAVAPYIYAIAVTTAIEELAHIYISVLICFPFE